MILLVDDNRDVLSAYKALLEAYGYQVAAYFSPIDALQQLKSSENTFSTLITDFDMPGMNGLNLIQAARLEQPSIRCILCSGFPPNRLPEGVALLRKPAYSKQLLTAIEGATALA